jgi:hypothetical protein
MADVEYPNQGGRTGYVPETHPDLVIHLGDRKAYKMGNFGRQGTTLEPSTWSQGYSR